MSDTAPGTIDRETWHSIARGIAAAALWSEGMCAFIGAVPAPRLCQPARQAVLGGDFYEGAAGIARFLGHAARIAAEDALRGAAVGAIRHGLARARGWSLHSGRLGAGLVGLELAELLGEPSLVQPSVEAIEAASETALAATDSAPADLLGGLAGVVHGLVAALPHDLDGGWRSRAFELGRALLASASGAPAGICWPTSPGSAEHLCGLARGAAGVALALARLAALAPEAEGWAKAAAAARGYERGWFSPEHASWADLRQDALGPGGPGYPQLWCHGSVGIAHERLRAIAAGLADPLCRADAAAAFAGAAAAAEPLLALPAGPGGSDRTNGSLCHGIGGVVDLLAEAHALAPDPAALSLMRRLVAFIRNDAGPERRWRSGIPGGGAPTPGLMLGRAGIGWAHLRTADPASLSAAWTLQIGRSDA
jgi:lantibiotic modifying enzyme